MRRRLQAGIAACALVLLTACTGTEEHSAPDHPPATVSEADAEGIATVTFTEDGASRVRLKTEPVTASGRALAVPYAALIYDQRGASWVYSVPEPLTFRRVAVVIDRVEGNRVLLSRGPAAGTEVVTTGAAEVYGAELDIAGNH